MAQAIKINSAGQVGPRDGIAVSVRNGDDGVLWITDPDNGPWTITFDKVPANPPPFGAPGVDRSKYPLRNGCPFAGGNIVNGNTVFTVPREETSRADQRLMPSWVEPIGTEFGKETTSRTVL